MPRYLLHFANHFINFRNAELSALSSVYGFPFSSSHESASEPSDHVLEQFGDEQPFTVIDLPNENVVKNLLGRSILLRYACELWTSARTYAELYTKLKATPSLYEVYLTSNLSYRVQVDSYGKLISQEHKLEKIDELLDHLRPKGRIDLKNAETTLQIFEYYAPSKNHCRSEDEPLAIYFGRQIGRGQGRLPFSYSIKTRACIGNTTMEPTMSFLMANMACVRPGSIVCDPFVGTGSLLVSAAHFGGYCVGTEINYNLLHGLGKSSRAHAGYRKPGENLVANFEQYGLSDRLLGACLADASRHDLWNKKSIFDAIITDPPYGIREKSTKVGLKPGKAAQAVSETHPNQHYPMKIKYSTGDVILDLLNFAADYLVKGGRLVYLLPVAYQIYSDDIIPRHPRLRLLSNCDQRLSSKYGRRLIAMEKICEEGERELDIDEGDGKAYFIRDCYSDMRVRDQVFISDNEVMNGEVVRME